MCVCIYLYICVCFVDRASYSNGAGVHTVHTQTKQEEMSTTAATSLTRGCEEAGETHGRFSCQWKALLTKQGSKVKTLIRKTA